MKRIVPIVTGQAGSSAAADPAAANAAGALSPDECRSLRSIAALVIPSSAEYGVPGADDDAIFADIVSSLGRDADAVRQALRWLDAACGGVFANQPPDAMPALAQRLREAQPAAAKLLAEVVARCYYRDDRVMRSLGMEPRAPFPRGFELESGDWSLLDPVRARGKLFRDAP